MSLSTAQVVHLLAALTTVLAAAHLTGRLFARLHQPPVIGEIVGGLLLGPTVLGALAPGIGARLFPGEGPVAAGLGLVEEIGLLLLMFLAGAELRVRADRRERRTALGIAVAGLVVPFAAGVTVVAVAGHEAHTGPHGSAVTFALVFGIAAAVAAIPVISRIMMDLGVLDTAFARIVLMVAVAEDAVLYIVLAVVLGLAEAHSPEEEGLGLWTLLGGGGPAATAAYCVTASLLFFGVSLAFGSRLYRWLAGTGLAALDRQNPTAFRLLFLFAGVLCCAGLGINPIFGALMTGVCAARGDHDTGDLQAEGRALHAWEALRHFALAFFVPVYFALVGLRLDLVRQLDWVFFAWFLVLACAVKGASVWVAARLGGEDRGSATRLAVALNARGTLGVLLATVTYGAGIINAGFFAALVLMSIVTCQIAGFFLDRAFRSQTPDIRRDPAPAPQEVGR